jgi:hypothetical protein
MMPTLCSRRLLAFIAFLCMRALALFLFVLERVATPVLGSLYRTVLPRSASDT